jgi:hypothetical protein
MQCAASSISVQFSSKKLSLTGFAPQHLAKDAHPGHRFAMRLPKLLHQLPDEGLSSIVRITAGVPDGLHDVEQELGEALAILLGGRRFMQNGEVACAFKACADELVEADGNGLAEIQGEMAQLIWLK